MTFFIKKIESLISLVTRIFNFENFLIMGLFEILISGNKLSLSKEY